MGKAAAHVEGGADAFHLCVVIGFPDLEGFSAWHASPTYASLRKVRFEATEGPSVAGPCLC